MDMKYAILYNIKDEFENPTDYFVDNSCAVYQDVGGEMIPIHVSNRKKDGRPVVILNIGGNKKSYLVYRLLMRARSKMDYKTFSQMVVDHKNCDSSYNDYSNLEVVTQVENMRRAGLNDRMPFGENHHNSKYKDSLVRDICSDISQGISRAEIMTKYGVNGQLVDDIRSGRSHKRISSEYLSLGFEYKEYDRESKESMARKVCELLQDGYEVKEIAKITGFRYDFVYAIYIRRSFRYISDNYKF